VRPFSFFLAAICHRRLRTIALDVRAAARVGARQKHDEIVSDGLLKSS
jgi:hypothetical protein